jgi:hypothetical protein
MRHATKGRPRIDTQSPIARSGVIVSSPPGVMTTVNIRSTSPIQPTTANAA